MDLEKNWQEKQKDLTCMCGYKNSGIPLNTTVGLVTHVNEINKQNRTPANKLHMF